MNARIGTNRGSPLHLAPHRVFDSAELFCCRLKHLGARLTMTRFSCFRVCPESPRFLLFCRAAVVIRDPRNVVISEHRMRSTVYHENVGPLQPFVRYRLEVSFLCASLPTINDGAPLENLEPHVTFPVRKQRGRKPLLLRYRRILRESFEQYVPT